MNYEKFSEIFQETIFEKSKIDLINKIAFYPNRYIGLFHPLTRNATIIKILLQSHEIRFGKAFETLIEQYLELINCILLPKNYVTEMGDKLNIDQCFKIKNKVIFIEQKVRDDHDSTKKRGQIDNFEKKLDLMLKNYKESELVGIFYFIDPDLVKNKKFYKEKILQISKDYNVETHIFYGKELFQYLEYNDIWDEILNYLKLWKNQIPDLPEKNFDLDAIHSFNEIKNSKPMVFRKILANSELFSEIILTLFPQKETLKLLYNYFSNRQETIYKNLANHLKQKLVIE